MSKPATLEELVEVSTAVGETTARLAKREAIIHAAGHSGLAIIMTSLTTAGAMASFASAALAPVAGLSLDHATVTVSVSAGDEAGEAASVKIVPPGSGLRLRNRLTTCASASRHVLPVENALFLRDEFQNLFRLAADQVRIHFRGVGVKTGAGNAFAGAKSRVPQSGIFPDLYE